MALRIHPTKGLPHSHPLKYTDHQVLVEDVWGKEVRAGDSNHSITLGCGLSALRGRALQGLHKRIE